MTECAHHYELDPVVDFSLHWTCRDCASGFLTGWPVHAGLDLTAVCALMSEQHGCTFTADPSAAARQRTEATASFLASARQSWPDWSGWGITP